MKKYLLASAALAMTCTGGIAMAKHHETGGMDHAKMDHSQHNAALHSTLMHERRADDKARDQFRNPGKTIMFMGIKPTDTVAEYAPGGGWYARVLAPYVAEKGKYIGVQFAPDPLPFPDDAKERIRGFAAKFSTDLTGWTDIPAEKFGAYTSDVVPEEVNGTVDFVFIPRMMHNLLRWNVADSEIGSLRKMLKDGGHLGIVQHRAKDGTAFSYADGNKGYLRTDTVVKFIESQGFELVKQSEVNANPKDTADYDDGVWTLPPSFRLKDVDKAKYEAIGESDRMTLLFKKLP